MGYRSKDTSRSRRTATAARADSQDKLYQAISEIKSANRKKKELVQQEASNKKLNQKSTLLSYYSTEAKEDKEISERDYAEWKGEYESAIALDEYKDGDNFFPTYDDFSKKRAKATIGGVQMSRSDMKQGIFDIEKLNLIMKLQDLQMNKKGQ